MSYLGTSARPLMPPRGKALWHAYARPVATARFNLICLPCAGGAAIAYRGWEVHLADDIGLWPIQMPGRGRRIDEPPIDDLHRLADVLFADLRPLLAQPHVIFGHSMGSVLGYELARRTEAAGLPPARLLVASARYAPHVPPPAPVAHLGDQALVARISDLGGTPPEVLASPEMLAFLGPVFRADFRANDRYLAAIDPIRAPIAAYGGIEDATAGRAELDGWALQTRGRFCVRQFPGGHFYLKDMAGPVLTQIMEDAA